MKIFTEKLHKELLSNLDELNRNYNGAMIIDTRLLIIVKVLDQIRQKLTSHRFETEEDEIQYFKYVLPETLSLYIYYLDKMELDRIEFRGSPKSRYEFYDRIYNMTENFRNNNKDFFEYCRDNKTYLDKLYFLRSSRSNLEITHHSMHVPDPSGPTAHCIMAAEFLAHVKLEREIHLIITDKKKETGVVKSNKTRLVWTGKQIDLIELGYAVKKTGSFNNGQASLKDIFKGFEERFEIDLGNTYRRFQEILSRKTGYTNFLDLLRQNLINRIDDIENENLN